MRDAGGQIAVLGQHAGRQDEHLLEVRCPGLDFSHVYLPSRLVSTVIHPSIMAPPCSGRAWSAILPLLVGKHNVLGNAAPMIPSTS